jgi:hypothetical protein
MILQGTNPAVSIGMYCPVCRTEVESPIKFEDEAERYPYLDLKDVVEVWVNHQASEECVPYDAQVSKETNRPEESTS